MTNSIKPTKQNSIKKWSFGCPKEESDALLKLVKKGKKTATSSLYIFYEINKESIPKVGEKSYILNSNNQKSVLIQLTKVEIKPFNEVDEEFAKKEGENDLSLLNWEKVHKKFFTEELSKINKVFRDDILILCEEFKVLEIL